MDYKCPYIAAISVGGIIDDAFTGTDLRALKEKCYKHFERRGFDHAEDDARIFDHNHKEIWAIPDSGKIEDDSSILCSEPDLSLIHKQISYMVVKEPRQNVRKALSLLAKSLLCELWPLLKDKMLLVAEMCRSDSKLESEESQAITQKIDEFVDWMDNDSPIALKNLPDRLKKDLPDVDSDFGGDRTGVRKYIEKKFGEGD